MWLGGNAWSAKEGEQPCSRQLAAPTSPWAGRRSRAHAAMIEGRWRNGGPAQVARSVKICGHASNGGQLQQHGTELQLSRGLSIVHAHAARGVRGLNKGMQRAVRATTACRLRSGNRLNEINDACMGPPTRCRRLDFITKLLVRHYICPTDAQVTNGTKPQKSMEIGILAQSGPETTDHLNAQYYDVRIHETRLVDFERDFS